MKVFKRYVLLWTLAFVLCLLILEVTLSCFGLVLRSYVKLFCVIVTAFGLSAGIVQCILRIPSVKIKAVLLLAYAIGVFFAVPLGTLICRFFIPPDHTEVRDGVTYAAESQSFMGESWVDYYEAKNFFIREYKLSFTEH